MSMETLRSGTGEFRFTDPDVIRAWMRDHKRRDFIDKTSTGADAVTIFVEDEGYARLGGTSGTVPSSL